MKPSGSCSCVWTTRSTVSRVIGGDHVSLWCLRCERDLAALLDLAGWLNRLVGCFGGLAGLAEDLLELLLVVAQRTLGLFDGDVATADQRLGVELAGRALGVDHVVHQRLRERGVVGLVVPAPAVADQVDDDVLLEGPAELEGLLGDAHDRFGVVAIDVEDRRLDGARDIGGVDAGACSGRCGGEADLVVDDHVNGAAGAVAAQLRQLERLGHNALPGEGGVTMHEERAAR